MKLGSTSLFGYVTPKKKKMEKKIYIVVLGSTWKSRNDQENEKRLAINCEEPHKLLPHTNISSTIMYFQYRLGHTIYSQEY